jgi:hypothetical protein
VGQTYGSVNDRCGELLLLLCESIVSSHAGNEGIVEDVSNIMGVVNVREK